MVSTTEQARCQAPQEDQGGLSHPSTESFSIRSFECCEKASERHLVQFTLSNQFELSHLKEKFKKFCDYLLTPMPVESRVKLCSPQNISGASQQNSGARFSSTTEVDGDLFQKFYKQQERKKSKVSKELVCHTGSLQKPQEPKFEFEKSIFTPLSLGSCVCTHFRQLIF